VKPGPAGTGRSLSTIVWAFAGRELTISMGRWPVPGDSVGRWPVPGAVAAAPAGVPAGRSAAGRAAEHRTSPGDGDAETRAWLADGAGQAHRATDIVGTMGVGGNTCAAVCFGARASPRDPALMVIISIVSCRVQETVRLFLAMPGTACPAARRPRSTEPAAPGYGGNARWTRRIGPDSYAWPWTNPGRNPALLKEIRTGAISSQTSDLR